MNGTDRPRPLVLCADDYGMNEGISTAILELAAAGRISAASCMTNASGWSDAAREIAPFSGRVGIGLHLTLTWGRPLGPMPCLAPGGALPALGPVIGRALSRRLKRAEIRAEIARQLDSFVSGIGGPPDFVDGHQHVHVLPVVRGELLAELGARGWPGRIWLRDPSDRIASIARRRLAAPKALLVSSLATGFRLAARRSGFDTNEGFSGFGPFDPARPVGPDMGRYLTALGPNPLVMCHPGRSPEPNRPDPAGAADEIAAARAAELDYLASPAFGDLLRERSLTLAPAPF